MMRCPDCNKFVGYDEPNTENIEVEIDEEEGTVTVQGELTLPCAECGTDLKSLNIEEEQGTADLFPDALTGIREATPEALRHLVTQEWFETEGNVTVSYELEDARPDVEATERTETSKP